MPVIYDILDTAIDLQIQYHYISKDTGACEACAKSCFRKEKHMTIISIDLGTGNSCVAIMEGGSPKVIENAEGTRTTPSIVAQTDKEQLVGQSAKRQAVTNPENTIFAAKRLIGRRFDDPTVQHDLKTLPYKVVKADNGDAWIEIKGKPYSPQEISAQILIKMKDTAEAYLGKPVTQAVITVPAYFNDAQRQATKDAGNIAGLEVLRIINEPTAAALAFSVDKKNPGKVVIFDCGSGTHDVSVLDIGDGVVEVLSTNGDTHLGGEDFDERILDYVAGEFQRDSGIDLRKDKMAIQRLRESAEKAKIELSSAAETEINLPYITADATGPKHLLVKLSRSKFENLVADLIKRAIDPCRAALADAGIKAQDIQEVIMVGGSTRIPAIRSAVKEFFGREPNNSVNPDEAVALGAAIQAGVLSGDVKDVLLLDVTPLSLGIETLGGVFTRLIDRNTTIPTKKSQVFSTADDNQSSVTIKVSQGEREMARDNKSLGQFDLDGIPPARRGTPQIEVTFDIDANGIVTVSARDQATGKAQHISIKANGGLTDAEIADMMTQAEANREADKLRRDGAEARNRADSMVASADRQIEDGGETLDAQLVADVRSAQEAVKLRLADTEATTEQLAEVSNTLMEACMKLGESQYKSAATDESGNAH